MVYLKMQDDQSKVGKYGDKERVFFRRASGVSEFRVTQRQQ